MSYLAFCIIGLLVTAFAVTSVHASDDPMYDFYGGLSNIIKKNMNNPDTCVSQSEVFIRKNIGRLQERVQQGRRMAQQNRKKYENMSEAEMKKMMDQAGQAMEAASQTKGFQAMMDFQNVFQQFAMKHPDHAKKIGDVLNQYQPQFE